jgi:hypothetical protein
MISAVHWTLGASCWLVLAAAGCAPQPDVVATDHDNGRHIQLRSGQLFDVVLADDYDQTRCQWRDEHGYDDAIVHLLGQQYQPHHPPTAGEGNGTNTERYEARQAGTVNIRLVESDNAGKVCRRYAVDVTVGPRSVADTVIYSLKQVGFVVIPIGSLAILGCLCVLVYRKFKRK